jgi:hypothetical protein
VQLSTLVNVRFTPRLAQPKTVATDKVAKLVQEKKMDGVKKHNLRLEDFQPNQ